MKGKGSSSGEWKFRETKEDPEGTGMQFLHPGMFKAKKRLIAGRKISHGLAKPRGTFEVLFQGDGGRVLQLQLKGSMVQWAGHWTGIGLYSHLCCMTLSKTFRRPVPLFHLLYFVCLVKLECTG